MTKMLECITCIITMNNKLDKITKSLVSLADIFQQETGEECLISFACTDNGELKQTSITSDKLDYKTVCQMLIGINSGLANNQKFNP